jgi:hypothetical protein
VGIVAIYGYRVLFEKLENKNKMKRIIENNAI